MRKTSNKPGFPGMKRVRQRTNSHCGPAVLEMLLSELKIFINQEKFVAAMNVEHKLKHHGMTVTELGDSVKRMVPTVNFWYRRGATVTILNQLVNKYKVPVGVEWQGIFGKASDGDDGHYAVITRIHPETNLVWRADPYGKFAGKDTKMSLKRFAKRWWDLNEVVNPKTGRIRHIRDNCMVFIIIPKRKTFPRELGLRKL